MKTVVSCLHVTAFATSNAAAAASTVWDHPAIGQRVNNLPLVSEDLLHDSALQVRVVASEQVAKLGEQHQSTRLFGGMVEEPASWQIQPQAPKAATFIERPAAATLPRIGNVLGSDQKHFPHADRHLSMSLKANTRLPICL